MISRLKTPPVTLPAGVPRLRWLPSRQEAVLAALLIALLIYAGQVAPKFLSPDAQVTLSYHVWSLALLTLPMTLIILTSGIDLSVGSTMSLCAVVFGLAAHAHLPLAVSCLLALTAGAAAGALNGVFVAFVGVHPLIVTLATLAAYQGIALGISLGRVFSGFPDGFSVLGQGAVAGLPVPGLIFLGAFLLLAALLARTPLGLSLSAIGYNETGARFSGLNVRGIKLALYTGSGLVAGLAALLFCSLRDTAKADIGQGMELNVITAVVLGGTSIFGGRGSLVGTLLGVLLIHETREFLSWQYDRDELTSIVLGVLLLLSVLADSLLTPKKR